MMMQRRERLIKINQEQKLTKKHYQASPTLIKVARLTVNGKLCEKIVDTGTWFIILRPNVKKHRRISDTGTKFILKSVFETI